MRKIKFRAWNRKINEMMYGVGVYDDMFICYMDYDEDDLYIQGDVELFPQDCQDFELMQYTGLKDSKGEEIYEGDIVKFAGYRHDPNYEGPAEVKFGLHDVDYGGITVAKALGFYISPYPDGRDVGVGEMFDWSFNFEVIGNVYEHPELLNKKG